MRQLRYSVAASLDGYIAGPNGDFDWIVIDPEIDFAAMYAGFSGLVMGRKSWNSLPKKPLPGRINVVVTRQTDWQAEGAVVAHSLGQATAGTSGTVMVIGGAEIYEQALPLATRIELTEVHEDFAGDASFTFDRKGWHETAREERVTPEGLRYSYVTLTR